MIKSENCIIVAAVALAAFASARAEWRLKWSDEFEADGRPDPAKWGYERGYVRNREWQYYQEENAFCSNGWLVIEARRDPERNYTSACVNTIGKNNGFDVCTFYKDGEMIAFYDEYSGDLWTTVQ